MPRSARIALAILVLATLVEAAGQPSLDITLAQGTVAESQTRDQLRRLLATHDVSPWIFTKAVVIDERAIPFSHPVLTLHTRHLKDDDLLLSTFVHEQLHWFLADRREATQRAIGDLRTAFPAAPIGGSSGARDEESTYLHLLVCYLEHQADIRLLGELRARQVMEFWAADHYTWIYRTVLDRGADIRKILVERSLLPRR